MLKKSLRAVDELWTKELSKTFKKKKEEISLKSLILISIINIEKKKHFLGNSLAFCSKASHHIMISRKIVLTFNKEIKHFYVENRHKYSFSLRNDTRGYN